MPINWFSRGYQRTGAPADSPPVEHAAFTDTVASQHVEGGGLDALAAILRTYGGHGFDIDAIKAVELDRRCEAWARHILTGTPAPLGANLPKSDECTLPKYGEQPRWADLLRFFRSHRRDEQNTVLGRAQGMRDLVSVMTDGLRVAFTDDNAKDELLSREMATLSAVANSDSLEDIRTRLSRTVGVVSQVIRDRQARYEAQLQLMGDLVHSLRTELVAAREKAEMDGLTHLHNRGAFDEVLAKQINFSFLSSQPVALVMVDLDHFKRINDRFGHPGGDLVLQTFADLLIKLFPRRSDVVARYGGEEFALILVDAGPDDLKRLSKRLLDAVRALAIDYLGDTIRVTCSIGIASGTPQDNVETLLRRADHALYQAKQEGRDRVVFAD